MASFDNPDPGTDTIANLFFGLDPGVVSATLTDLGVTYMENLVLPSSIIKGAFFFSLLPLGATSLFVLEAAQALKTVSTAATSTVIVSTLRTSTRPSSHHSLLTHFCGRFAALPTQASSHSRTRIGLSPLRPQPLRPRHRWAKKQASSQQTPPKALPTMFHSVRTRWKMW